MRSRTTFLVSLVWGLSVLCCGRTREPGPDGTGGHAAALGPRDDDLGGDATSVETRDVCVAACKGGPSARAQFCELAIPAFYVGCRKRVAGSTAVCIAWCFWTY